MSSMKPYLSLGEQKLSTQQFTVPQPLSSLQSCQVGSHERKKRSGPPERWDGPGKTQGYSQTGDTFKRPPCQSKKTKRREIR